MSNPISLPPNLALEGNRTNDYKPADIQVTSSDILKDANHIRQSTFNRPQQTIQDLDELRSYQLTKRKEFEQQLNKNRLNFGQWIRYAKWEIDHNHDFKRARSIMERALEVNVQHIPFWVRYVEIELLHKNVNHARNLLDRAVTTLPRTDKLWFMYVQTEESLANYRGVRAVFERWLTWKPPKEVWDSYIAFEKRYDEYDNLRNIYLRYLVEFGGEGEIWWKWAKFEVSGPAPDEVQTARVRGIFEGAIDNLAQQGKLQDEYLPALLKLWADWEMSLKEAERSRAVYTILLELGLLSKQQQAIIFEDFSEFEKRYGLIGGEDATVRLKRLYQYEKDVAQDPRDYDSWWDYIKLQESDKLDLEIAELLKNATLVSPIHTSKLTSWRRYVFLWIKLAWIQELNLVDINGARAIWKQALEVVAKQKFTFAKLWILYSEFELRNGDDGLTAARKILGRAIGQSSNGSPKNKIFKHYIALERKLGEWTRVRKLYEKWLELSLVYDQSQDGGATNLGLAVLKEFVQFEQSVDESDRCVGLFEAVIAVIHKTTPESDNDSYYFSFIEFLKEEMLYDRARQAYREKLTTTPSAKVWILFALFESQILSPSQLEELESTTGDEVQFLVEDYHRKQTRAIFTEAFNWYKSAGDSENAIRILEAWKDYESAHGTDESLNKVIDRMPTAVKKRRTVEGVEEVYVEYVFPEIKPDLSKFLANARKWALNNS